MTLPAKIEPETRRVVLEGLKASLLEQLPGAKPYEVAQLSREIRAVLKELAELPAAKEVNPVDEFVGARARRQARAKVS